MRSFIQNIKGNLGIEKSHHILLWIHLLMLQTRIDLFVDAKSCQKNYEGCNILIFIEILGRLSSRVDGFLGMHIIHSFNFYWYSWYSICVIYKKELNVYFSSAFSCSKQKLSVCSQIQRKIIFNLIMLTWAPDVWHC